MLCNFCFSFGNAKGVEEEAARLVRSAPCSDTVKQQPALYVSAWSYHQASM